MVFVPNQILTLLEQKGEYWLMAAQMGKYQAILVHNPNVTLQTTTTLSPVTLLQDSEWSSDLQHDCLGITNKLYSSRLDQLDHPLTGLTGNYTQMRAAWWKMVKDETGTYGHHKQGNRSLCHRNLNTKGWTDSPHLSLRIIIRKNVNIYTDYTYAFLVVHAHGAIWKERGILTLGNKGIKHVKEI